MARPGTKDFRCQLDTRLVDAIEAVAMARTAMAGKKIDRADIVAEALEAYLNVVPRLEQAANVADLINQVRKLEANLSDQIERGFAALVEADELRSENQILNAAALYSQEKPDFE